MQRYSFWVLVCFFLSDVHGAESNASDRWRRSHGSLPVKDSFLPQPPLVQVENYRYQQEAKDAVGQSGGAILEQVIDEMKPITDSLGESKLQHGTTSSLKITPLQSILRRIKAIPTLFDQVDRSIFSTTLPLSAVFAIIPIAGTLDLFWVNRLGDALAVAGQAAANQVYNSAFWLFAFLPTITATLVSKSHASGDIDQTQDSVCQALLFALLISIPGAILMFFHPSRALASILKGKNCSRIVLCEKLPT